MMSNEQRQMKRDRKLVGASSACAVLDFYHPSGAYPDGRRDPYTHAGQVFADIVKGEDRETTAAMNEGNYVERAVLDWAEDVLDERYGHEWEVKYGTRLKLTRDEMRVHPNGIMCANFDGIGDLFIVEAKWKRATLRDIGDDARLMWGRAAVTDLSRANDQIPQRTIVQVQAQLAVAGTDYKTAWVAILRGDKGFGMYRVERNDTLINAIVKSCERFHAEHILPAIPPQLHLEEAATRDVARYERSMSPAQFAAEADQWLSEEQRTFSD
jgi:hypothetical protein